MVARVRLTVDVPFSADVDEFVPDVGARPSPDGVQRVGLRDSVKHERQAALVESQRRNAAKDADDLAKSLPDKVKFGSAVGVVVEEVRDA